MNKVISLDALQRLVINPLKRLIDKKVEKVDGKGLSTNDYTTEEKETLANLNSAIGNKVDKVEGMGLSTEDFTTEEKEKLAGVVEPSAAHQHLVTDADGNKVWEEKLAYESGFSIQWDGDTTGLVASEGSAILFKVSDETPTADELVGMTLTLNQAGQETSAVLTEDYIDTSIEGISVIAGTAIVAYADGAVYEDFTFPESGIYFARLEGEVTVFVSGLVGTDYLLKKIDEKYLPEQLENAIIAEYDVNTDETVIPSAQLNKWAEGTAVYLRIRDSGVSVPDGALVYLFPYSIEFSGERFFFYYEKNVYELGYSDDTKRWYLQINNGHRPPYIPYLSLESSDEGKLLGVQNGEYTLVNITHPVTSVNTKTGDVVLTAEDVGALPDTTVVPTNITENYMYLIDQVNGHKYYIEMRSGNIVSYCEANGIEVTTMPTQTEYVVGSPFNPEGMVITITCADGTTREAIAENITYPETVEGSEVQISYTEFGVTYTTSIFVTTNTIEDLLIDFEYTANDDGTYTITDWKGTLNGEASTEIVIPDNEAIKV